MQTSSHVSLSLVEFDKLLGRDAPWGSHAEEEEEEQMKKQKLVHTILYTVLIIKYLHCCEIVYEMNS
jgi:hypothetical protein